MGKWLFTQLLGFTVVLYEGFVISKFWEWFITRNFDINLLPWAAGCGIALVLRMIVQRLTLNELESIIEEKKSGDDSLTDAYSFMMAFTKVLIVTITLCWGWVLSLL